MHSAVGVSAPSLMSLAPARLWDADSAPAGVAVSSWASRAGGSTATQSTPANQPAAPAACTRLRNRLAVSFDGTDRLVDGVDLDCSTAWTALRVFDLDALKNEQGLLRLASSDISGGGGVVSYVTDVGHLVLASANTSWYVIAYNSLVANTAYALLMSCDGTGAGIVIEVGTFTGGTIVWSNRILTAMAGTFAMPAASGQRVVLGGGWSSAGALLSGRSAVEAWWTRVLTTAEKSAAKAIILREYI